MYSGITQGLYPVVKILKEADILNYTVRLSKKLAADVEIGDSVAVDGVCQTVMNILETDVSFQAIPETLSKTSLHKLTHGSLVSIEKSLRYGDYVGGHEVSGHVFGTGVVSQILKTFDSLTMVIHCNPSWMKYIFSKGFIAVDGSSLTVGDTDVKQGLFTLHLIPETLRLTNFGNKKLGDLVNIEFDYRTKVIVETVERLVNSSSALINEKLT